MRRGRARDPLDVLRPPDRLARPLFRQMLRNEGVRTQPAAAPLGTVDAAGDDGTVLVDDLHHTAWRKVAEPQAFLEMFELHADGHHGFQLTRDVGDRAHEGLHPFAGRATTDWLGDHKPLSAQHSLEIVTIGIVWASL